ncbi:hypothetical protein HMPREF0208_02658 [Citrobacter koseri]|uniref:Uncharacterized protein n=1 Tax=Citrobacter koseri (strain ATCC BAA-895 / CDC 4225-83 / SGSC4696) TaxID=290338 RepID=A8AN19_CITK8|nr:hypothetical protein CKO_03806 [Citrobacter koseri ATCC BAA-895]KWZ95607.1 hypothetical protein HMPREF3220_03999 [Citrobacter koseri]KXA01220.1 hypothetical protein HMPREF3207_02963 [Citrobacter koseri]KXB43407.1 hypothetical protein HMPREF0208_02658 [Citrobacter koseri]
MLRSFVEFFNAHNQYHLHGILRNPFRTGHLTDFMHNNASLSRSS